MVDPYQGPRFISSRRDSSTTSVLPSEPPKTLALIIARRSSRSARALELTAGELEKVRVSAQASGGARPEAFSSHSFSQSVALFLFEKLSTFQNAAAGEWRKAIFPELEAANRYLKLCETFWTESTKSAVHQRLDKIERAQGANELHLFVRNVRSTMFALDRVFQHRLDYPPHQFVLTDSALNNFVRSVITLENATRCAINLDLPILASDLKKMVCERVDEHLGSIYRVH